MREKVFDHLMITAWGAYILWLTFSGKLGFFIHPRYFTFTASAAWVLLVVGLVGLAYYLYLDKENIIKNRKNLTSNIRSWFVTNSLLTVLWVSALLIAVVIPPRSLSARSASQRASVNNAVSSEAVSAISQFVRQRDTYGIGEWIAEFKKNPDVKDYLGQEVSLEGFVLATPSQDPNQFTVSKFIVRCCVVDASPLGIPVNYVWKDQFKESQWVRVHGTFIEFEQDGQAKIAIAADKVEAIDTPSNPYIY